MKLTYLQMATTGIHSTDNRIRIEINTIAHGGQSNFSVIPLEGTHAEYPDPSATISTTLATRMEIMASGDKYFQHTNQYSPGR